MNFIKNENGQGMVEYALIIGLVAVIVIAAIVIIGQSTKSKMNKVSGTLSTAGNE